jgi:two-component system, OmpR family, phosphate regulon sensor histidine kinase PhoR
MRLNNARKYILIALLSMAILMLVILQVYFVFDFIKQERKDFSEKAQTLVELISIRHEKLEERRKYEMLLSENFEDKYYNILKDEARVHFSIREQIEIHDTTIFIDDHDENYVIISGYATDSLTGMTVEHRVLAKKYSKFQELMTSDVMADNFGDEIEVMDLQIRETRDLLNKSKYINDIIVQAFREDLFMKSTERIDFALLESIILEESERSGLGSKFEYRVVDSDKNALNPKVEVAHYIKNLQGTIYETELFPADIFHDVLRLQIHFPDKALIIWKRLTWVILVTIIVVIAIIVSVLMLTKTLINQQHYNTMKSDFISNMTHEFKTPISTISLACEALTDKDLSSDANPDNPFVKMIHDENKRLESLVESILQSAVIEKGELKIKTERVDVHNIISNVIKNTQLRVLSQHGELSKSFNANNAIVEADPMHLTNVIANLLDNAIKYCDRAPMISVSTRNDATGWLLIEIKDNGIGIKKEHQSRIFEKLYRVPTGNVHNVKGFGLGLSYVKTIIDLHGGKIELESQLNAGSTFTIKLKNYG